MCKELKNPIYQALLTHFDAPEMKSQMQSNIKMVFETSLGRKLDCDKSIWQTPFQL